MSVKAIAALLLAGLPAASALTQSFGDPEDAGVEIAPEKQVRFFATSNADVIAGGRSRGRFSGHVTSGSIDAGINALIPVDESTDATLSITQTSTGYDFSSFGSFGGGRTDPIDYGLKVALSGTVTHAIDRDWSIFAGASINSEGEVGADFDETLTYGGYVGVSYRVHEDLLLGLALGGFSELEDDFNFFPIPTLNWQIDDYWRLVVGRAPTVGQPGAEIAYEINDAWSVGASLTYDFRQFRLEDDNSNVPGGVLEDASVPLYLIATWSPEPKLRVSGRIGSVIYREIDLRTQNGNSSGDAVIDPTFAVGLSLEYAF